MKARKSLKQQLGLVLGHHTHKLQSRMSNPGIRKGTAKPDKTVFAVTGRKKYNSTRMRSDSMSKNNSWR